jgi:hypothetical protein
MKSGTASLEYLRFIFEDYEWQGHTLGGKECNS